MRTIVLLLIITTRVAAAEPAAASPQQVAKDFFAYLAENHIDSTGVDIGSDANAQEKFLSNRLRNALHATQRHIQRHQPLTSAGVPFKMPDNKTFLLAWDPPKRFTNTRTLETPYTAIVAGRAIWGADQQYRNQVRPTFFVLVFERGAWRIDDIQAGKANFNGNMSLLDELASPLRPKNGT